MGQVVKLGQVMCALHAAGVLPAVSGRSAGREFVVAFPQHSAGSLGPAAARLYVTSCSWQPIQVTISLPGQVRGLLWPASHAEPFTERRYRLAHNGDTVELELPTAVHLDGSNIENKGIDTNSRTTA